MVVSLASEVAAFVGKCFTYYIPQLLLVLRDNQELSTFDLLRKVVKQKKKTGNK